MLSCLRDRWDLCRPAWHRLLHDPDRFLFGDINLVRAGGIVDAFQHSLRVLFMQTLVHASIASTVVTRRVIADRPPTLGKTQRIELSRVTQSGCVTTADAVSVSNEAICGLLRQLLPWERVRRDEHTADMVRKTCMGQAREKQYLDDAHALEWVKNVPQDATIPDCGLDMMKSQTEQLSARVLKDYAETKHMARAHVHKRDSLLCCSTQHCMT